MTDFLRRLLGGRPPVSGDGAPEVDGDAQVIAQLAKSGADLSQPRPVDHYLYLPDEPAARAVAARLIAANREIELGPAARGSSWLVHIVETMIVDLATVRARRAEFDAAVEPAP